jgi:hypothetical protein
VSSKKDQFDDEFRPFYPKDKRDTKPSLKEISFMPSTVETIDYALYDWMNDELNIFCTTNEGWKKVPLIWSMPERAFQIKDNKDLRNLDDIFTFPVMSVERTSLIKDPQMKGVAWAHIPRRDDAKGGAIAVARRIQQKKTANFANTEAENLFDQQTYPFDNKKIVYETITMPMPTYVVVTYKVTITTEYQQQMNEIFTPFITSTGQIDNFFINRDGHKFEGFIQGEFGLENNISNLGEEERKFQTTIDLKILGYLMGADKNDDQPKITIRESAAEFRFTRERVMIGDKKEY